MKSVQTKISICMTGLFLIFGSNCTKVKTDNEIMQALEATVANCKIETRYGWAKNCKNAEADKLKSMLKTKGQAASLGTLAIALGSQKEEIRAVAADRLYDTYRSVSDLEKNPQLIDGAAVDLLIENLAKFHEYASFYAARATTFLAMLTGKQDALYAALKQHPQESTRSEGYRNLMRYGRLTAFPMVKELVAAGDKRVAPAAAAAPRDMHNYTTEEKKEVCEWAVPLMQNENESVASNAAQILALRCKGEYIDKMLDEAEKRAGEDRLKRPFASALINFTFSCKAMFGTPPTGSEEQCKRKETLKKKVR